MSERASALLAVGSRVGECEEQDGRHTPIEAVPGPRVQRSPAASGGVLVRASSAGVMRNRSADRFHTQLTEARQASVFNRHSRLRVLSGWLVRIAALGCAALTDEDMAGVWRPNAPLIWLYFTVTAASHLRARCSIKVRQATVVEDPGDRLSG